MTKILLSKEVDLHKNETELKMENSQQILLERRTVFFSSFNPLVPDVH